MDWVPPSYRSSSISPSLNPRRPLRRTQPFHSHNPPKEIMSNASRPPSHHEILSLDISTLTSVCPGAKAINDCVASGALLPICALILSAAIQHNQGQTFTNDGLESNFGVDYLSNVLPVLLLLQSMGKESGCVVIIPSRTHDHPDTRNSHIKGDSHKIIFKDVDTPAKPLIEDTKAGK